MTKYIGCTFIALGTIFLLSGVASFFYVKDSDVYISKSEITTFQNGTSGMGGYRGARDRDSSRTKFVFFKYSYTVDGNKYKNFWFKMGSQKSIKMERSYYKNPLIPQLSVLEKGVSLVWVGLFYVVGFGVLEIRKWLFNIDKP